MKKVYLAKSNRSNPDDVQKVRGVLNDNNCEIVEFKGGSFSHKAMLECDMLVVVPDLNEYIKDDGGCDTVAVGKGLYEQVQVFKQEKDDTPIYIVRDTSKGWDPNLAQLDDSFGEIDCPDNYINYGWLCLQPMCGVWDNLSHVLDEAFGAIDEDIHYNRMCEKKRDHKGRIIYPKEYLLIGN